MLDVDITMLTLLKALCTASPELLNYSVPMEGGATL